jgi:hypothetical protein
MGNKHFMRILLTPAFTAAVGLLVLSSLHLCAHLLAYWVLLSGRLWPHAFRLQLVTAFCALGIVALLLFVAGVARLLRMNGAPTIGTRFLYGWRQVGFSRPTQALH